MLHDRNVVKSSGLDTLLDSQNISSNREIPVFRADLYVETLNKFYPVETKILKGELLNTADKTPNDILAQSAADKNFQGDLERAVSMAHFASVIANHLLEYGAVTMEEHRAIVSMAMLQGLNREYRGEENEIQVAKKLDLKNDLLNAGIKDDDADYILSYGSKGGFITLKNLTVCGPDGFQGIAEGNLDKKIAFLADCMTSDCKLPAEKRATFLTFHEKVLLEGTFEKHPFLWQDGVALDTENNNLIYIEGGAQSKASGTLTYIDSFIDLKAKVAEAVAREIKSLIEPTTKLKPELFVKELVNSSFCF